MSTSTITKSSLPHRIRVVGGPLRGAILPLPPDSLLRIGRGDTADLQLHDERVSREHAQVVAGPDGIYWLVDLGSSNGTRVGSHCVDRFELTLDTTFHIEGHTLLFERDVPVSPNAETRVVAFRSPSMSEEPVEPDTTLRKRGAKAGAPARRPASSTTKHRRIMATHADGTPYAGNLVEDIAELHDLRRAWERGEIRTTRQLDRLESLDDRLGLSPRSTVPTHMHTRMSCYLPVSLRLPDGQSISAATVGLGGNGAELLAYGHGLSSGDTLWLTIELVKGRHVRTLVFSCRVMWCNGNNVGLWFSGQRRQHAMGETWRGFRVSDVFAVENVPYDDVEPR